jgi:hypothetical protein
MLKFVVACSLTVLLTACGGGGGGGDSSPSTPQVSGQISKISLAQNLASRDVLVNGKTVAVRATTTASTPFPASIKVTVSNSSGVIYENQARSPELAGPVISNSTAYTATIPGEFVKPGIKITVIGNVNGSQFSESVSPSVGPDLSAASITIVPLVTSDGISAKVPTVQEIRDVVIRHLPLPDDVKITVSAPQKLSVPLTSNQDWVTALSQLSVIRSKLIAPSTSSSSIFYGFAPHRNTFYDGISYVGSTLALGTSSADSWARVFTHELGHLLSLKHAPCGTTDVLDTQFPYSGGKIGPVVPFNVLTAKDEPAEFDVMGYCGGKWFSDYSYEKAAKNAEAKWVQLAKPLSARETTNARIGFMVAIGLTKLELLGQGISNPGGELIDSAFRDGNQVISTVLEIDHSEIIHVWIEGQPTGNFVLSINGKHISFSI